MEDALRANDARLVAAALGPYGSAWLDDHAFRQGVLKCVFMSIPLRRWPAWTAASTPNWPGCCRTTRRERRAAGRPVPRDVMERI